MYKQGEYHKDTVSCGFTWWTKELVLQSLQIRISTEAIFLELKEGAALT